MPALSTNLSAPHINVYKPSSMLLLTLGMFSEGRMELARYAPIRALITICVLTCSPFLCQLLVLLDWKHCRAGTISDHVFEQHAAKWSPNPEAKMTKRDGSELLLPPSAKPGLSRPCAPPHREHHLWIPFPSVSIKPHTGTWFLSPPTPLEHPHKIELLSASN
ncbi:unnamed protein product [Eretmochelys imbricata]